MICGSDGILAKPTNDNGKIANDSELVTISLRMDVCPCFFYLASR
jgi:hypothetical protein